MNTFCVSGNFHAQFTASIHVYYSSAAVVLAALQTFTRDDDSWQEAKNNTRIQNVNTSFGLPLFNVGETNLPYSGSW